MKASIVLPILFVTAIPNVAFGQQPPTLSLDLEGAKVDFVRVADGRFTMGSAAADPARKPDETAHSVTLSSGFYMQTTPVTVGVWKRFVDATDYRSEAEKGTSGGSGWNGTVLVQAPGYDWKNPGFPQTDDHPVTIITYDDALEFTRWATRVTKRTITLPTEAQWEYAYRAGTTSTYYDPKAKDPLELGWFKDNAGQGTKPVRQKKPNAWGIYDMGGNVWQWCLDWYAPYSAENAIDPMQTVADASDKPRRVLRGGSWLKDRSNGRAAARFRSTPGSRNADTGFRVVVLDIAPSPAQLAPPPPAKPAATVAPSPAIPTRTEPVYEERKSSWLFTLVPIIIGTGGIYLLWQLLKSVFGSNNNSNGNKGSGRSGGGGGGRSASTHGISVRPGADGFWIHANPGRAGAHITVNYRSMGISRVAHATVESHSTGQFIYTGHTPETLDIVHVSDTSDSLQNASDWSSSNNHSSLYDNSSSSSSSSFQGYPPAY